MAYTRPPVQPGRGLKRSPGIPAETTAGVLEFALDADIATTTSLGLVQVGSGLSITAGGILSAAGSSGSINVYLTNVSYLATVDDYYIGAVNNNITVTFPLGTAGKVYIVKNQVAGNITVTGSGGQKLDTSNSKSLGTNDSLVVVFDGTRWNIINS